MPVPVMQVRIMGMRVGQFFVPMPMAVRFARRIIRSVGVLMVLIMVMQMLMLHRLMLVHMLVVF